jgi:hypothetical protein
LIAAYEVMQHNAARHGDIETVETGGHGNADAHGARKDVGGEAMAFGPE